MNRQSTASLPNASRNTSGPSIRHWLPGRSILGVLGRVAPGLRTRIETRMIRISYNLVSRSHKDSPVEFMNYGYASLSPDDPDPELATEHSSGVHSIQLYYRLVKEIPLAGRDVLEVGSGRGGGAAFVMRHGEPRSVTGVDFADTAVEFCNRRYRQDGLSFRQGNAESLPFDGESFDVVINVESSHCYGSMERFVAEVFRVLRPGGLFLFTDFRDSDQLRGLRDQFDTAGFVVLQEQRITPNVLHALELDDPEKRAGLDFHGVRGSRRRVLEEAMAVKGTPIFERFRTGASEYVRYTLQKPLQPPKPERPSTSE